MAGPQALRANKEDDIDAGSNQHAISSLDLLDKMIPIVSPQSMACVCSDWGVCVALGRTRTCSVVLVWGVCVASQRGVCGCQ